MKRALKLISLSLVLVLLATALVSCGDKSSAVKKAFEKEEYTVTTVDAENSAVKTIFSLLNLTEEQKEDAAKYELMVCTKSVNVALVIKFPSSKDIQTFLVTEDKDGKEDTALYDKAKENGWINGNCLILTVSNNALSIFKEA